MLDKKQNILTAAEALFEKQGVKKTSMQEIAKQAGISKGAVYLHFKSKDELLLAVCESHTDKITQRVKDILNNNQLSPLEKLAEQIRFQFEELQDYQGFYQSLFNDDALTIGPELIIYYQEYRLEWQQLQESFLLSIYCENIKPWIVDLAISLDGLVSSYISLALFDELELNLDPLVSWVVRAIDKIAHDIVVDKPLAVLNDNMLASREEVNQKKQELKGKYITSAFERLTEKAERLKLAPPARETLTATLAHIQNQLKQDDLDEVMLRALLAGLRTYRGLSKERQVLAEKIGIELV